MRIRERMHYNVEPTRPSDQLLREGPRTAPAPIMLDDDTPGAQDHDLEWFDIEENYFFDPTPPLLPLRILRVFSRKILHLLPPRSLSLQRGV